MKLNKPDYNSDIAHVGKATPTFHSNSFARRTSLELLVCFSIWISACLSACLSACFSGCLFPSVSFAATTLQDLDKVVAKASNLDDFLSNEALVNEYYKKLANYYGEDRFPRASFDAILTQLREVSVKVPEIKQKLWSKEGLGEGLSIQALPATDNLEYDPKRFAEYSANYRKELQQQAASLLKAPDAKAEVKSAVSRLERKVDLFQSDLEKSGLSKKQKGDRTSEFYKALEQDTDAKAIRSYMALERMNLPDVKKNLSSSSPEILLSEFDRLRRSPPPIPGIEIPSRLANLTRQGVPNIETVIAKSDAFRSSDGNPLNIRLESQTYDFKPIERRLHGIWKGVVHKECVGGSCDNLKEVVPDRWAIPALEGTRVYHVEKDGKFQGYIQEVPMKHDGKVYTSIDIVAPELEKTVIEANKSTGESKVHSLFDAWYLRANRNRPEGSAGYIVGNSDAIHNGRGPSIVRASPYYVLGEYLTDSAELVTLDRKLEKDLVSLYKGEIKTKYTRGAMIHETGTVKANAAMLLGPETIDESRLEDADWIRSAFSADDPDAMTREVRIFAAFEHRQPNPAVLKELQTEAHSIMEMLKSKRPAATKFIREANPSTIQSLLRYTVGSPKTAEDLPKIVNSMKLFIEADKSKVFSTGGYVQQNAKAIAGTRPSFEEALAFRKSLSSVTTVEAIRSVSKSMLDTAQTSGQYLRFFDEDLKNASTAYIKANRDLIKESLKSGFIDKGATVSDALKLINMPPYNNYIEHHAMTASASAELAKTPSEYESLFKRLTSTPHPAYNLALDKEMARTFDHFLNLKPSPTADEVSNVVKLIRTPDIYVQTLKKSLERFDDSDAITKLLAYSSSHPSDEERLAMSNMIVELKGELSKKNLTTKQWQQIRTRLTGYINSEIALMEIEFMRLQDPADYLKTVEIRNASPSRAFLDAHYDFISRTWPKFQEMNPPAHVVKELLRRHPYLEERVRPYLNSIATINPAKNCANSVRQLLLRFGNK